LLIGIGLRIDPLVNTNICFDQSVRQMALCDNPAIHRCGHLSHAELTSFSDRSDTRNQLVARDDRAAKPHALDTHEVDDVAVHVRAQGHEDGGDLGHRLDDQRPGHDRMPREVSREEWLMNSYMLEPDNALARFKFENAVHKQDRIPMRKAGQDLLNVHR